VKDRFEIEPRKKRSWSMTIWCRDYVLGGLAAATFLLLLPSCASLKETKPPAVHRVWPPPPAEPRVAYVESISCPQDLGIKSSGWRRLCTWLTGRSKTSDQLNKPFGLALDEMDNLCVADTGAAVIWYFDRGQKRSRRWEGIGRIQFISPVAVVKRNDTFFVADSGLPAVLAFNDKGKLLLDIRQGLARPSGLAILNDKIFVADAPSHCVSVFDKTGKALFKFGRRGAGPGDLNFPTHIAIDRAGQLLVTDSMNSRVEVFDAEGRYQGVIGSIGDTSGHFSRPKGVAVDTLGHVYVVDALVDKLKIFDSAGRFLLDVGEAGSNPGEFWLPNGIAISRDNQVFVADSYNHRVQVFKYMGTE